MTGIDRFCIVVMCACITWLSIKMHNVDAEGINIMDKRLDVANERIDLLRKRLDELHPELDSIKKQLNEQK